MSELIRLVSMGGHQEGYLSGTDPVEPVRGREEIAEAIRAFTPADSARLRLVADKYARLYLGRPSEAEDLIQEAFRRALDGERKCPVTVHAVKFLADAIQSIADAEANRTKRRPRLVALPHPGDPEPGLPEPMDPAPNAEERAEEQEEAVRRHDEVIGLFADDPAARDIVEGIMLGMRGEELRTLTGLDETKYQSKRRLILRRIEKFKRGPKP
jgi:DNA-directed RNA polymerase specialized sigma24 family protein